jgi:hypothetical protein
MQSRLLGTSAFAPTAPQAATAVSTGAAINGSGGTEPVHVVIDDPTVPKASPPAGINFGTPLQNDTPVNN